MNTPHERFLASGFSRSLAEATGKEFFQAACDYALLQLQSEMRPTALPGVPVDPYVAIDANSQMWGAARVLEILKHLHEPADKQKPVKGQTLHY